MSTDNVDLIENTQISTSTLNADIDVVKPQQV